MENVCVFPLENWKKKHDCSLFPSLQKGEGTEKPSATIRFCFCSLGGMVWRGCLQKDSKGLLAYTIFVLEYFFGLW